MEAALRTLLLANAALTALIGGDAPRITWNKRPQAKALPAIVLNGPWSSGREYHLGGRDSQGRFWVQMDCWAATMADAIAVREALLAVLDTLKTEPLQAFEVIRDHASWDFTGAPDAARSTDLYRASLDVRVVHTPT